MSDLFYSFIRTIGRHPFWLSSRPTILHRERLKMSGPFILAPNHFSPFDVALLIAVSSRRLDWVSIVEVFRKPLVGWFYGSMNAFPLDRGRPDSPTVRIILDRLKRGRAVAMFPEGHLRTMENSVLVGAPFRPGIARIAQLANVPVIPCAIVGTSAYARVKSWLPLRRVRYGIHIGQPIHLTDNADKQEAQRIFLDQLRQAYIELYAELKAAMSTTNR